MDYQAYKTHDLQSAMIAIQSAEEYWAAKHPRGPADDLEVERARAAKAEIKAELARRGERDYDWMKPQPARRLPG